MFFVINVNARHISHWRCKRIWCQYFHKQKRERERGIETLSLKVLSTRIVIQSVLLYTRSEETTKVEGEKDGDGGSWVSLFRVCVRGDMMYACSSCDTRCSQDGKGIIEFERFFFLSVGPVSPEDKDTYLAKLQSWETTSGGKGMELALILLFVSEECRQHKHFARTLLNQLANLGDWLTATVNVEREHELQTINKNEIIGRG